MKKVLRCSVPGATATGFAYGKNKELSSLFHILHKSQFEMDHKPKRKH